MARVYNFGAGPATLPVEVLQEAQADLVDYKGSGMSIMEMSHRGKEYDAVHNEAVANVKTRSDDIVLAVVLRIDFYRSILHLVVLALRKQKAAVVHGGLFSVQRLHLSAN